ncbi:MAG TPA: DUF302 domain-containing protein [Rhodocyclaceae bacterium]|nr:DUF302 domain-containing protein [Rhodocyclaceae bacterium]HND25633.1 DUF302 domain-containing protein [Rhodocyclaceae bacterium]
MRPLPRLACLALLLAALLAASAYADELRHVSLPDARYADAREALVDAIEGEGLIPSPPSRFGDMLARTGPALGQDGAVYGDAEVLHFCSARVAWQLARENPVNIAQCPLSMAIYTRAGEAGTVYLAWRPTQGDSAGSRAANALLERIAAQVSDNTGRARPR